MLTNHFRTIVDVTNVTESQDFAVQSVENILGFAIQYVWTVTQQTDARIGLKASNNGTDWDEIECISTNILKSGTKMFNCPDVYYRYFRPFAEVSTGSLPTLKIVYSLKS